ncbi:hypothetical protein CTZ27_20800 [Streptomyces griseocarneus]|nr:hypothetical protein CTZ27_20800 [Streptomyces griseocarneus]
MLRHATAPAHGFTRVANDIIRHGELSSDAVRLLIWQLGLPPGVNIPLWEVAQRAGIKNAAFIRAKRELIAAGYLHEWREQRERGRWVTVQLVSGEPLDAEGAAEARAAQSPSPVNPAVGEPGGRSVGDHPYLDDGEKTDQPPQPAVLLEGAEREVGAAPERVPEPGPEPGPVPERDPAPEPVVTLPPEYLQRGAYVLTSVSRTERRLRLTGPDIAGLAPLAGEWFQRGACVAEVRDALTGGLPSHVHSAAGIIRNRLIRKMPDAPTFAEQRALERRFAPPPPPSLPSSPSQVAPAPPRDHDSSGAREAALRGASAVRAAMRGMDPPV